MSHPSILLSPISLLYGAATRLRVALYRKHLLESAQLNAFVISVGNITTGGTGKTPMVALLARLVHEQLNKRVCILSRGYGRMTKPHERILVSDGVRLLSNALAGGDEPQLLAEMLQGKAAVVSCADRVAAARWALRNLGTEVFILDDGFQHLRMQRNLDIVLIDGSNPWGGRQLLPRGRLREPLSELRRADLIIITRAEQAQDLSALCTEATRLSGREVLTARTRTCGVHPLLSSQPTLVKLDEALLQPLAAFCAIGNAEAFFRHLSQGGYRLNWTRAFADHHRYTQHDVDRLVAEASRHGAQALLTTAKDAVKLHSHRFALPCYVVEMSFEFDEQGRMIEIVREKLEGFRATSQEITHRHQMLAGA